MHSFMEGSPDILSTPACHGEQNPYFNNPKSLTCFERAFEAHTNWTIRCIPFTPELRWDTEDCARGIWKARHKHGGLLDIIFRNVWSIGAKHTRLLHTELWWVQVVFIWDAQSMTGLPYSCQPLDLWIEVTMNRGSSLKAGWLHLLQNDNYFQPLETQTMYQ